MGLSIGTTIRLVQCKARNLPWGRAIRINRFQEHPGPDDECVYHDDRCALGHRRLAIIDLSHDGHEPFVSDNDRYYLSYNGEIYNYIELWEKLRSVG